MKGKHIKQKEYRLSFCCPIKNLTHIIKPCFRSIVIEVIVGLIVLLLSFFVSSKMESRKHQEELSNNLSSISLGMSKKYIDELFGEPIIENECEKLDIRYKKSAKLETWYDGSQGEGRLISAGYKLPDSAVLCLYRGNNLVAFIVVVNKENLYKIPASTQLHDHYLLDFTYEEFSETVRFEGNVPANNNIYAYYFELLYGGGTANYNYFIIGSYQNYQGGPDVYSLMFIRESFGFKSDALLPFYPSGSEKRHELRKNMRPNVFGMISSEFPEMLSFIIDVMGSRENGALLFADWSGR